MNRCSRRTASVVGRRLVVGDEAVENAMPEGDRAGPLLSRCVIRHGAGKSRDQPPRGARDRRRRRRYAARHEELRHLACVPASRSRPVRSPPWRRRRSARTASGRPVRTSRDRSPDRPARRGLRARSAPSPRCSRCIIAASAAFSPTGTRTSRAVIAAPEHALDPPVGHEPHQRDQGIEAERHPRRPQQASPESRQCRRRPTPSP